MRALLYAGADYPQQADRTIVRFAMIETAQALDNLDAILSVEGLDAIYVGPSDLSLSLGCKPVLDDVEAPVASAIDHILARVPGSWRPRRNPQWPQPARLASASQRASASYRSHPTRI